MSLSGETLHGGSVKGSEPHTGSIEPQAHSLDYLEGLLCNKLRKSIEHIVLCRGDTDIPKDGAKSVGGARQYCGQLGTRANC